MSISFSVPPTCGHFGSRTSCGLTLPQSINIPGILWGFRLSISHVQSWHFGLLCSHHIQIYEIHHVRGGGCSSLSLDTQIILQCPQKTHCKPTGNLALPFPPGSSRKTFDHRSCGLFPWIDKLPTSRWRPGGGCKTLRPSSQAPVWISCIYWHDSKNNNNLKKK